METFGADTGAPRPWELGVTERQRRRREAFEARLREARERVLGKGAFPEEAWLPVVDLRVDPSYQRTGTRVDHQKVLDIALNWSWDMCGRLVVNQRPDGTLYVIDGGHRKAGFALLHDGPLLAQAQLPCLVTHYKTKQEEAAMFDKLNEKRTAVGYEQRFQARLTAEEPVATQVVECISNAGLTPVYLHSIPGHKSVPGEVAALRTCELIVKQTDAETLSAVLTTMVGAWRHEQRAFHRTLIAGVFDFHVRFVDAYVAKDFQTLLRRIGPDGLLEAVPVEPAPRSRGQRVSFHLHKEYNRKRSQHRLPPFEMDGEPGLRRVVRRYNARRQTERGAPS